MRKPTADWPAVLEQYQESGLSQKRFCEKKGVSLSSLNYWLKKKRSGGSPAKAVEARFVELSIASAPDASVRASDNHADLVVELPFGVILRFRGMAR